MKKDDVVNFKEWPNCPVGGMELYNPKYRSMNITDILKDVDFENEWKPFGYARIGFCRTISTIFILR